MTAVSLKTIDEALFNRYSGIQIDVAGVPTNVEVFVEEPSTEEYSERVFPSISIKLLSMEEDSARRHSADELQEEISYDDMVSPPVRTMRQRGEEFILKYTIDTWHKIRAGESRDLLRYAIIERTPPRGYMTVEDVDGGSADVWVLWSGTMATIDELLPDVVIYHKSLTVNILATLLTDTTTEDYKVVTEAQWTAKQIGDPEIDDITFRITEDENGDEEVTS